MLMAHSTGSGPVFLAFSGLLAGFVDSIAGGGGLITLPSLSLALGPGVDAIGTNKICGVAGALIALIVYVRRGHMDWRSSIPFATAVGGGGFVGSRVALLLPPWVFPWLLALTCPVILYVVWEKDLWIAREETHSAHRRQMLTPAVVVSGLLCGFYDGVWGPGSGTFMFLALLFVARLPLLPSLAAAKLANSASGLTALVSYVAAGHVHTHEGVLVAAGTVVGGFVGANQASTRADRVVRPVLLVVVTLLLIKLVTNALGH